MHQNIDALSLHIQGEAKKDIDAGRPEAVVFDRKFFPEYPATNFLNIPDKRTLRNLLFLRLHPDKTTMLNGVNVFVFLFKLADELYKFYYDSTNPEIQIGNDDGKYVMPFLLASYNPSWKVRANMLWQEYLNKNAAEEADRKAKEEEERAQRAREEARKQQREEREREAREEAERQRREKEEREEARKQQREQKAKEAAQFISALDEGLKTIHSLKDQKLYQIMVDGAYYNAIHCIDSQISVSQYMMWAFVETFLKQCFVLINNKTITASETQIAALESLKKIVSQSHIGIDLSEDFKTNFTKRIKQFDDIRKDLKKEKEQKPNREANSFIQCMEDALDSLDALNQRNMKSVILFDLYENLYTPVSSMSFYSFSSSFISQYISACLRAIKDKKIDASGIDLTPLLEFQKKMNQVYGFGNTPYAYATIKDQLEKNCKRFETLRVELLAEKKKIPETFLKSLKYILKVVSSIPNVNEAIVKEKKSILGNNNAFSVYLLTNENIEFIKSYLTAVVDLADQNRIECKKADVLAIKDFMRLLPLTANNLAKLKNDSSVDREFYNQFMQFEEIRLKLLKTYRERDVLEKKEEEYQKSEKKKREKQEKIKKHRDIIAEADHALLELEKKGLYDVVFQNNPMENRAFKFKMEDIISDPDASVNFLNEVVSIVNNKEMDVDGISQDVFSSLLEQIKTTEDREALNVAVNTFAHEKLEAEIKEIKEEILHKKHEAELGTITPEEEAQSFAQTLFKQKKDKQSVLLSKIVGDDIQDQINVLIEERSHLKKGSRFRRKMNAKIRQLERFLQNGADNKQYSPSTFPSNLDLSAQIKIDAVRRKMDSVPKGSLEWLLLERELSELTSQG